jgi:hypothetical protein
MASLPMPEYRFLQAAPVLKMAKSPRGAPIQGYALQNIVTQSRTLHIP